MSKFQKKFEDIMSAAAFAEAGEFETAKQILKGRQKVLLVIAARNPDMKSSKYAMNICKRIEAALEILYISGSRDGEDFLKKFKAELKKEGIEYSVVKRSGCIKKEILAHTDKRSDILFVVVESSDTPNIDCSRKELLGSWGRLKCPLVIVSDAA